MNKSLFTEKLGLFGWNKLEPVILAALATEEPMLLVGKHGCAKSYILESLSKALNLNYRFYNASLINYDDLVGIPVPVNNNTELSYISNKNSIWDAEVVFLDEINRTKPELQNKLFPIIYDRRIQGTDLPKLKFRFAAMNPPFDEELIDDDYSPNYIGAVPLDPALADRFPFVIEVPTWDDLSVEDRNAILMDQFETTLFDDTNINELIKETQEEYKTLIPVINKLTSQYILCYVSLLEQSIGYISPRRVTMFNETLIAIQAACNVINRHLSESEVELKDVVHIHAENTLPNIALQCIDKLKIGQIVDKAIKVCQLEDDKQKDLMFIAKPENKLKHIINNAHDLNSSTLNEVVLQALKDLEPMKRRAVSLCLYRRFRYERFLAPTTMEVIVKDIRPIFKPTVLNQEVSVEVKKCQEQIDLLMVDARNIFTKGGFIEELNLLNNLMNSFLPNGYSSVNEVDDLYIFYTKFRGEIKL